MLQLIAAILLGTLAGTFTGLIPGVHTNLIATLTLSALAFLLTYFQPITIITFIASMAIAHTFIDFIPSIFFGAPDEDTGLSVLPGHDLLLKGHGHAAVNLTLLGSALSIILLIIIVPIFIITVPPVYPFIQRMMAWFLILISIFLISKEKESKIWALIIFILAGFLGIATLNSPMDQPLLPLLTGLFGSSTLIYSISKKITIPEQKTSTFILPKKKFIKPAIATALVSPICSFLPGLGSSQAAIIGSEITGEISQKQFLILLGSINTLVMSISFVTLFLTQKTRTGAANAISQIAQITPTELTIILLAILISATISFFTASIISKFFARHIHKFNYTLISTLILVFLTSIISITSGKLGMFTLVVSTLLGLTCIYAGIRRGFLMGALLIPTILFYLPF
ncbi:hypothetical protein HOA55_00075 [archaeon]|jgi:putative membrane protein|nr:hypothetical protein [archaeon]MBT3577900.1 hypothetical protein [archaeon]MBT6819736.1 hypothetical protein [archaeon]MBT6956020.1 hypothetical protein [archaeon]MBT7025519.1 hypothetical protein [archaeon]